MDKTHYVFLTVLFFLTSMAFGRTIVVDRNNPSSGDSNSGNPGNPFKTIAKAADVAAAGDTVLVKEGRYEEVIHVKNSGTLDKAIVFTAENDNVILTHSSAQSIFNVLDKSFIHINGFTFRDAPNSRAIVISSSDPFYDNPPYEAQGNIVENCRFINMLRYEGDQPHGVVRIKYAGPNCVFRHNYFKGCYGVNVSGGGFNNVYTHNTFENVKFKQHTWSGQKGHHGSAFKLGGDEARKYGYGSDQAERTKPRACIMSYNTVTGAEERRKENGKGMEYTDAIWADVNCDYFQMVRNTVIGSGYGVYVESRCDDALVLENVVIDCQVGITPRKGRRNQYINNTAIDCKWAGIGLRDSGWDIVKNNISINNGKAAINVYQATIDSGRPVFANNLWWHKNKEAIGAWGTSKQHGAAELTLSQWIATSGEKNALSEDPIFVSDSANAWDLRLQRDSPAKGAGDKGQDLGAYPFHHASGVITAGFYWHTTDTRDGAYTMNIPVVLNKKALRQVTVTLALGLGSFAEKDQYDINTMTLTFKPCETEKSLTVTVKKDHITSPTRLVLAIDSIQGAERGAILDHVIWMYSPNDNVHQNVKP